MHVCARWLVQWPAVNLEARVLSAEIEDARSRYHGNGSKSKSRVCLAEIENTRSRYLGDGSVERRVRSPETEYSWSRDL